MINVGCVDTKALSSYIQLSFSIFFLRIRYTYIYPYNFFKRVWRAEFVNFGLNNKNAGYIFEKSRETSIGLFHSWAWQLFFYFCLPCHARGLKFHLPNSKNHLHWHSGFVSIDMIVKKFPLARSGNSFLKKRLPNIFFFFLLDLGKWVVLIHILTTLEFRKFNITK